MRKCTMHRTESKGKSRSWCRLGSKKCDSIMTEYREIRAEKQAKYDPSYINIIYSNSMKTTGNNN